MHNHLKWIVTFEKYKILHEKNQLIVHIAMMVSTEMQYAP